MARPRGVLVTGASSGIGAACALGCARQGMTVFAGVRTPGGIEQFRQNGGPGIIPIHLDVTDVESIRRAADKVGNVVLDAGLSGLVNNAGIAVVSPLESVSLDALRRQLEVCDGSDCGYPGVSSVAQTGTRPHREYGIHQRPGDRADHGVVLRLRARVGSAHGCVEVRTPALGNLCLYHRARGDRHSPVGQLLESRQ